MIRASGWRGPDSAPQDVLLGADWVERWLGRLVPEDVCAYLCVARVADMASYQDGDTIARALGLAREEDALSRLRRLEAKGLLEVVSRRERHHIHLRCRGEDGVHRAEPVRPSIKEAIALHKEMMEELVTCASEDETPALRERFFDRYPELGAAFHAACDGRRDGSRFRLWLELALHHIASFEERFGSLKADHAEVFKDVSAQILRLKLEVIERLTQELLERRAEIFPAIGEGWISGMDEGAFLALPVVRELSRRYRVGAEQIYLNTIEALQQEGLCIVDLDARGHARDLLLPTTTGLSEEEERLVFLHSEELALRSSDADALASDIIRARARYAGYLTDRGVRVLLDLSRRDRLSDADVLLQVIADRVGEALELVSDSSEDPRLSVVVTVQDVTDAYARAQQDARTARVPSEP